MCYDLGKRVTGGFFGWGRGWGGVFPCVQ